jgi:hypothetical protein
MPTLINTGKTPRAGVNGHWEFLVAVVMRGTTAARRRRQGCRSRTDPVGSRLGMPWARTVTRLVVLATHPGNGAVCRRRSNNDPCRRRRQGIKIGAPLTQWRATLVPHGGETILAVMSGVFLICSVS